MNKMLDESFESIVYISHPYGGAESNQNKITELINCLIKQYPNYLFLSPVHAFGFTYSSVNYETGIAYCLWLLEKCDEMWVYGDWEASKGCNIEVEYCRNQKIPYYIKSEELNDSK